MKRSITIVETSGWYVHQGERHSGQLSWDEMLGQVAVLTAPVRRDGGEQGLFGMLTPEEWQERQEQLRLRIAARRPETTLRECLAHLGAFIAWHGARAGNDDALAPGAEQPENVRAAMNAIALLESYA